MTVVEHIAQFVEARLNCLERLEAHPDDAWAVRWAEQHQQNANEVVDEYLPSGSGFDAGTHLDWERSNRYRLVFQTSFHHMTEGYYDGWTEHQVIVKPRFGDVDIRVTGRDRNDIKEYIAEAFYHDLQSELPDPTTAKGQQPVSA